MNWVDDDPEKEAARKLSARLSAERASKALSASELKADIMRLVAVRFDEMPPLGVRLAELNRRFGVAAARFQTTTRELVTELIGENRLGGQYHRESLIVYDKQAHNVRCEMYRLREDPERLDNDLKAMAKRTVTGE